MDADNPTKGLAGAVIKIVGVDNDFTGTYVTGEGGYLTDVPWKDVPASKGAKVTVPSRPVTTSLEYVPFSEVTLNRAPAKPLLRLEESTFLILTTLARSTLSCPAAWIRP